MDEKVKNTNNVQVKEWKKRVKKKVKYEEDKDTIVEHDNGEDKY